MKKTIFSFLIFIGFLSTLTFAQDSNFTQQEIESLFIQDSQPLELIALSDEEMKTTEGAWLPYMAVRMGFGAFYGGVHNIAYQIGRNQGWSWKSFGRAVAFGAAMGYYSRKAWGIKQIPLKMTLAPATMGVRVAHGRVMTKYVDPYVQPRLEAFKSRYFRR